MLLKDIITIAKGRKHTDTFTTNESSADRFIQIDDLRNDNNLKYTNEQGVEVKQNDLIIAWDGANAGTTGFGLNGFIGSTLARLRIKQVGFDTNYLGWFLRSQFSYLQSTCTGATIPHISRAALENLFVPNVDLQIQKQIASILEIADHARQQRKAANAITEQFLQSSFLHLFGDIETNDKNWETKKFENVVQNFDSKRIPIKEALRKKGKFPYYGATGIIDYVDEYIFEGDYLLIAEDGKNLLGRYKKLAFIANGKFWVNNHAHVIKANNCATNEYLEYALNRMDLKGYITGIDQLKLNRGNMDRILIPVPPLSIQQHFASLVAGAERLRQKQKQSERELEQLFQALLQKYFGKNVGTVAKPGEHLLAMAAEPEASYKNSLPLIPANKKGFAKYVLAGNIIKECRNKKEFTHIRFQKLQHLAEYLLEEDLEQNFYYQAAGPYDNELMHNLANKMRQQRWFNEVNYQFLPLEKEAEIDRRFSNYFNRKQAVFEKLMTLLGDATEAQCEIVSTLYAIWNDLIISKEHITEEVIIARFYQWSDRKKRYTKEQLAKALNWIRQQNIEPVGFGPAIKHKKARKRKAD